MLKRSAIWSFVAAVVLLPMIVFGVVRWYENRYADLPILGPLNPMEDFQLQTHYGTTSSLQQWKNRIVVANLFFTHCPVVCPKLTRSLKRVQQVYIHDPNLLIQSFSVDPERDSVQQMLGYAKRMDIGPNWDLLTGAKTDIYRFARKSLQIVATDGDGGANDFIHSEMLVLIDPERRIRGYYKGTDEKEVDALIRDIQKLESSYAN